MTFRLVSKTIWLFSTESWGRQLLSKHHFAITLQEMGYSVLFFNPTQSERRFFPVIEKTSFGVSVVSRSPLIKGERFLPNIFLSILEKFRLSHLVAKYGKPSYFFIFESNYLSRIQFYKTIPRVLFVYDLVHSAKYNKVLINQASLLVTISTDIAKSMNFHDNILVLQHGLNKAFENYARGIDVLSGYKRSPKNALFIGSLFKKTIDTNRFINLIDLNSGIHFHFFGAFQEKENNLGGFNAAESVAFINKLIAYNNVTLYGVKSPDEIVQYLPNMDFCVHLQKQVADIDISNAHKLIEYIATGLPIYGTNVEGHEIYKKLIFNAGNCNDSFHDFLQWVISVRSKNDIVQQLEYALANTYRANIDQILRKINAV